MSEYFSRWLVFRDEYFSGMNIFLGGIFFRSEYFSGGNFFEGWINFRGVNKFQGYTSLAASFLPPPAPLLHLQNLLDLLGDLFPHMVHLPVNLLLHHHLNDNHTKPDHTMPKQTISWTCFGLAGWTWWVPESPKWNQIDCSSHWIVLILNRHIMILDSTGVHPS